MGEGGGQRWLRGERMCENGGIHESEVYALAELRAEGVGGIAEDGDAVTVPVVHADVMIGGGGDLLMGVDFVRGSFWSAVRGRGCCASIVRAG